MSIEVILTEKEIYNTPNDAELGELVRNKYWELKNDLRQPPFDLDVEYDNCVLCGKVSPYTRSTHIDYRIGYIEGAGQGCFQPKMCDKD
jgi:hypothetical protein